METSDKSLKKNESDHIHTKAPRIVGLFFVMLLDLSVSIAFLYLLFIGVVTLIFSTEHIFTGLLLTAMSVAVLSINIFLFLKCISEVKQNWKNRNC